MQFHFLLELQSRLPHSCPSSLINAVFLTITDLDLITEFDFLPNCARFP